MRAREIKTLFIMRSNIYQICLKYIIVKI